MKAVLKTICIILGVLILVLAGYVAYVFIDFHRIGDRTLSVEGDVPAGKLQAGTEYRILSYNIGFGAYESDYGFFMDGGREAWAWSKERLDANLKTIAGFLTEQAADLTIVQEVDIDSTRSYHFDERTYLTSTLGKSLDLCTEL